MNSESAATTHGGPARGLVGLLGACALLAVAGYVLWRAVLAPARGAGTGEQAVGKRLVDAARRGDQAELKRLLDQGADVNFRGPQTPLLNALVEGRWACANYLISRGARTDDRGSAQDPFGNLLIASAARPPRGQTEGDEQVRVARHLLAHGFGVADRNGYGYTALHQACYGGATRLARELIAHGADVNARSKEQVTPLWAAASYGRLDTLRLLMGHGADPTVVPVGDRVNRTAVEEARYRKHGDAARLLAPYVRDWQARHRRSPNQRG